MCNLTKDNIIQQIENIKIEVESLQGVYSRIVESGALEFFGIEDNFEISNDAKEEINELVRGLIDEVRELDSVPNQAKVIKKDTRDALIEDLENGIKIGELADIEELLNEWLNKLSDKYILQMEKKYLERLKKLDKYLNPKSWSIKKKYKLKFKQIEKETGLTKSEIKSALKDATKNRRKREEI